MKEPPKQQVKFYADSPDRTTQNKQFTYGVHDLDHSYDILNRFVNAGWKVRAAWHSFAPMKTLRLDLSIVDGDLSTTYAAKKVLEQKLDKWQEEIRRSI